MSKLGTYIRRHGKPYALRAKNGKGEVQVRFNDGYVTIFNRQPGTPKFEQQIHITRKAWIRLLNSPQLRDVTRMMEGPSFDVYKAERKYLKAEARHEAEMRRMKRQRQGRRRRAARET